MISPMIDETGARNGCSTSGRQTAPYQRELLRHDLARALDVLAPVELRPDNRQPHGGRRPDASDTRRRR